MTEAEKLDAGLEYDFTEPEVRGRKFRAVKGCQKLNGIDMADTAARDAAKGRALRSYVYSPMPVVFYQSPIIFHHILPMPSQITRLTVVMMKPIFHHSPCVTKPSP